MSLKLTCSAFRLQRALGFLLGKHLARGQRPPIYALQLEQYSYTVLSSWPEAGLDLIEEQVVLGAAKHQGPGLRGPAWQRGPAQALGGHGRPVPRPPAQAQLG